VINFSVLDDHLITRILDEAFLVLEKTGVEVQCDELLERMEKAGLPVNKDTRRITFPRSITEKSIASAPEIVQILTVTGILFPVLGEIKLILFQLHQP